MTNLNSVAVVEEYLIVEPNCARLAPAVFFAPSTSVSV